MTLDAFVAVLWRRRLLVIVLAMLGAAAGIGASMLMTKVYTATAVNFVTAVPAADKGASYETAQFAVSRAKNYSVLVDSPQVLTRVIAELQLPDTPDQLAKKVSAENPIDTILIKVSAKAGSPEMAQRIADAVARQMATEIKVLERGETNRASPVDVQLAVPAARPEGPSEPRPMINGVLGGLVGFALASIVAIVRNQAALARKADTGAKRRWWRRRRDEESASEGNGAGSPTPASSEPTVIAVRTAVGSDSGSGVAPQPAAAPQASARHFPRRRP